jgi:hypothetical protein
MKTLVTISIFTDTSKMGVYNPGEITQNALSKLVMTEPFNGACNTGTIYDEKGNKIGCYVYAHEY